MRIADFGDARHLRQSSHRHHQHERQTQRTPFGLSDRTRDRIESVAFAYELMHDDAARVATSKRPRDVPVVRLSCAGAHRSGGYSAGSADSLRDRVVVVLCQQSPPLNACCSCVASPCASAPA